MSRFLPLIVLLIAPFALASGPRWVTGHPFFYGEEGRAIVWYTDNPLYFTDPGDLSAFVNHSAADAMVAAAASVWNVPTSRMILAQGGTLDEHLSSQNVYLDATGPVFPTDVRPSNYLSKQIAVLYDSDGSVTDLLLGGGASDPVGCRQNAVTESVDSIVTQGQIRHALLILNGRCTGPEPEKQLQLQYQLIRAFGRILGLGWAQANDNVFTGSPRPTYFQALHWPLMHPIDILCGTYTYQCLPEPFTLRPDDIASITQIYNIFRSPPPGKVHSLTQAGFVDGTLTFPDGQGMQGVNIVARREQPSWNHFEEWDTVSAVSGFQFRRADANPVSGSPLPLSNMGTTDDSREGYFLFPWVPLPEPEPFQDIQLTTEPINPLYSGTYAVGPYLSSPVTPSGSSARGIALGIGTFGGTTVAMVANDAVPNCPTSLDGSEASPAPLPASGSWSGTLCGYGHQSWHTLSVKPGHSLTFEVTALDESGFATTNKAMPMLGVWASTDPMSSSPGIAAVPGPFNASSLGMTQLRAQIPNTASLRLGLADQRGDGRPDFAYKARILYADAIVPSVLPPEGGTITLAGIGFRPGNAVNINGVQARVSTWTSTSIVATAPSLSAMHVNTALTADVTVTDLSTGATTQIPAALSYSAPTADTLTLRTFPGPTSQVGDPTVPGLSVSILRPDGTTPVVGSTVTFTAAGGAIIFAGCTMQSPCTTPTDIHGVATISVTPATPGLVTLTATAAAGTVNTSFTATPRPLPDIGHILTAPPDPSIAGSPTFPGFSIAITKADGVTPVVASAITFTTAGGAATFAGCATPAPCTVLTDTRGVATVSVTPTSPGTVTLTADTAAGTLHASFLALPLTRTVTVAVPVTYIAAGATGRWNSILTLSDNSASVFDIPISWSAVTAEMSFAQPQSLTDSSGTARMSITVAPLQPGQIASASACAFASLCASVQAVAVGPAALHLTAISGAAQTLPLGETFAPLTVRVSDPFGNPILAATVNVYETVQGIGVPCPSRGRCPVAPIYGTRFTTLLSDPQGVILIRPLQRAAAAGITRIAVAAGTYGQLVTTSTVTP